jgi:type IV secretory pathway VirB9-like protein
MRTYRYNMAWKIKIRMHQDYQNYPAIPFRIPSRTMDTWGDFSGIFNKR